MSRQPLEGSYETDVRTQEGARNIEKKECTED